jgi:hypothetical protein
MIATYAELLTGIQQAFAMYELYLTIMGTTKVMKFERESAIDTFH